MKNNSFESLLNNAKIHIDSKDMPFADEKFCQMKDNAKITFEKSQKADFSDILYRDKISNNNFLKYTQKKSLDTTKVLSNSKNHNEQYFITNKVFD